MFLKWSYEKTEFASLLRRTTWELLQHMDKWILKCGTVWLYFTSSVSFVACQLYFTLLSVPLLLLLFSGLLCVVLCNYLAEWDVDGVKLLPAAKLLLMVLTYVLMLVWMNIEVLLLWWRLIVYMVVTHLKNEMNRGDFFMTLRNQPVALSLYKQVSITTNLLFGLRRY